MADQERRDAVPARRDECAKRIRARDGLLRGLDTRVPPPSGKVGEVVMRESRRKKIRRASHVAHEGGPFAQISLDISPVPGGGK